MLKKEIDYLKLSKNRYSVLNIYSNKEKRENWLIFQCLKSKNPDYFIFISDDFESLSIIPKKSLLQDE